eukprot:12119-Eustigmatos_ZCMA.PRE.1
MPLRPRRTGGRRLRQPLKSAYVQACATDITCHQLVLISGHAQTAKRMWKPLVTNEAVTLSWKIQFEYETNSDWHNGLPILS